MSVGFEEIAGRIKELGNVGTGCERQEQRSFLRQCQEGSRGTEVPSAGTAEELKAPSIAARVFPHTC